MLKIGEYIKGRVVAIEQTTTGGQEVTLELEDSGERDGEHVKLHFRRPERPLFAADPNCDHDIEIRASGYGCTKCPGWFCL